MMWKPWAIVLASWLLFLAALPSGHAHEPAGGWKRAKATFYDGGPTSFGGACGYEDVVKAGFSLDTAAVSSPLFNEGKGCGACYEIQCLHESAPGAPGCKPGQATLTITATNLCPPSDHWCAPPQEHFDLAKPAFLKIAEEKAGVVPIQYRRVACKREGGIRFSITGNPYYNLVSVWNVGGAGDVEAVQVKCEGETVWRDLKRNWGQKWEIDTKLVGQRLSFRVKTSDGKFSDSNSICPNTWQFGQTFEGQNFLH